MKQIKILNILPNIYSDGFAHEFQDRHELSKKLSKTSGGLLCLDNRMMDKGNVSIENFYDGALVTPYILRIAKQAQDDGFDAALIECLLDPALDECRESLTMPVFGAGLSSYSLASRLGGPFTIISILAAQDRNIRQNLRKYALIDMLASLRVIDTPVLELHTSIKDTVEKVLNTAEDAVKNDGAKSIIIGCTGMSSLTPRIQGNLQERGIDVPVIDAMRASLFDAVSCVMQGVSHSKTAYPPVRLKHRELDWDTGF